MARVGGGSPSEQNSPVNSMYAKSLPGDANTPATTSPTTPVSTQMSYIKSYGFQKGQSGNPSGKAREARITRAMAERASPEAFGTLMAIMRSKKASLKLRKECAVEILDRGGVQKLSPFTKVEGDEEDNITVEFDDALIDKLLGDDDPPEED